MSSSLFLDPKHGHAGEVGGGGHRSVALVASVGLPRESKELAGFWLHLGALQTVECVDLEP